ncbi:MAG: hypothetical protein Q7T55_26495 [Solirubrobacteraceae bacterium]|nr:hypothetical protein [Solirubrobacteraceae bacterium]
MDARDRYANELAEAILRGDERPALEACRNDSLLTTRVALRASEMLTDRTTGNPVAVPQDESWWIRSQLAIWHLSGLPGAHEAPLADTLLTAICSEVVSGPANALDLGVMHWLARHDPKRIEWLADPGKDDELHDQGLFGGGRFLFAALFALPGPLGAKWLPVLCGYERGIKADFAFQDMHSGVLPRWSDDDWRLRFEALAATDGPRPRMLDMLFLSPPAPATVAVPLSRLFARDPGQTTDTFQQTVIGLFRLWRVGDAGHDAALFDWTVSNPDDLVRLAWLVELSGDPSTRASVLDAAAGLQQLSEETSATLRGPLDRPTWAEGEVAWELEPIGDDATGWVSLPDGRLAAGDPIWGQLQDLVPVELPVPSGRYLARVIRAVHPLEGRHNVAAELLVNADADVVGWVVAPGDDGSFFCENGRGAIGAPVHVSSQGREDGEEADSYDFEDVTEVQFIEHRLGDMIAFAVSPQHHTAQCWVGLDVEGRPARLVAELGILDLDPTARPLPG